MYDISTWDVKFARLEAVYRTFSDEAGLARSAPASEKAVAELERSLGVGLPPSLRQVLLEYSGELSFAGELPKTLELPQELRELFSVCIELSLDGILNAEESRQGWVKEVFPNPDDSYDKVWHNKLGFMEVGNGDVLAFDLDDSADDKRVVYLSHDDGDGHGRVLGKNFGEFMENLIAVGGCGMEDWQILPFLGDGNDGILPDCKNAVRFRALIGLER